MVLLQRIGFKVNELLLKAKLKIFYGNKIRFGKGTHFRKRFSCVVDRQGSLVIGDHCFFNNDCSISCMDRVEIGRGTIFGENVKIYDHNHDIGHPAEGSNYFLYHFQSAPISIGENCWIGSGVIILSGVKIGNNVVVGAGTLVNKDIPSDSIVYDKKMKVTKCRAR